MVMIEILKVFLLPSKDPTPLNSTDISEHSRKIDLSTRCHVFSADFSRKSLRDSEQQSRTCQEKSGPRSKLCSSNPKILWMFLIYSVDLSYPSFTDNHQLVELEVTLQQILSSLLLNTGFIKAFLTDDCLTSDWRSLTWGSLLNWMKYHTVRNFLLILFPSTFKQMILN